MATTAFSVLLRRAIRELEAGDIGVLPDGTTGLTALAAGSVTVPTLYRNTNLNPSYLSSQNAIIARLGAATAADVERYAGALTNTTGLVLHTGADYADVTVGTEVPYFLFWGVHVAELIDAANRIMEFGHFTTNFALSHMSALDGDMMIATDTNWTDIGTLSTSAKATTGRRTPWGVRSYNTVNNAVADSGTRSATLPITIGGRFKAFVVASTNVGTSSLQPYSITAAAATGTVVTSTNEAPQFLHQDWQTISSTASEMAINLTNTSATGDTFWDQLWVYLEDNLVLPLPPQVTEHYQVPFIFQARPVTSAGSASVWPAQGVQLYPLVKDRDYRLQINQADANPTAVIFDSAQWFDYPLFVQGRVPYSYRTTWTTDETTTTEMPVHEFMPRFKRELLDSVYAGRMPPEKWARLSAQVGGLGGSELQRSAAARPVRSIAKALPYFRGARRL